MDDLSTAKDNLFQALELALETEYQHIDLQFFHNTRLGMGMPSLRLYCCSDRILIPPQRSNRRPCRACTPFGWMPARDPLVLTWHRMLRVTKKIDRYASEPILAADLSRPQSELLAAIAVDEGLSQQIYADRMLVTKGNITQHLERFEARGLITRRREGRTNYLYLTDTGHDLLNRVLPEHDARLHEEFSVLTAEEFEHLQAIICKLDRLLG